MISAKKLYAIYFLLLGISSVSYISFSYYPIPQKVDTTRNVKGYSISGPFAFLPAPAEAIEVSSTYSTDGMNVSFVVSEKCNDALSFYYETILTDRGWVNDFTEYYVDGLIKGYSNDNYSLEINFLTEGDTTTGESCLVNLLGSSN